MFDIAFESLKTTSIGLDNIADRVTTDASGLKQMQNYLDAGQSVLILTSHYANWEWASTFSRFLSHPVFAVYKTIKNKAVESMVIEGRKTKNMELVAMEETYKVLHKNMQISPMALALIADQNPSNMNTCIWVDFFGKRLPCLRGGEFMAKRKNLAVFHLPIIRKSRGKYHIEIQLLSDTPKNTEKGEITQRYMSSLENLIKKNPSDWLWTHKRWKNAGVKY